MANGLKGMGKQFEQAQINITEVSHIAHTSSSVLVRMRGASKDIANE